jgi:hypothetical protein
MYDVPIVGMISADYSIRPLSQLNRPFVPSRSHIRLAGTRKLYLLISGRQMRWRVTQHLQIAVNQEDIKRQQPHFWRKFANLVFSQVEFLELPARDLSVASEQFSKTVKAVQIR